MLDGLMFAQGISRNS
uniref:Uncharacterized protein n=1 Tax=Anguilla anguilla TaxID=7936 RepID=A0A0E9TZX6_ANGAN